MRKDDTVDYGYLVVTKGDPAAKEDTPDLMLYVVQDSKNAKAKGIAPMEKEAFLSMAQTIAASVKRRPTSPLTTLRVRRPAQGHSQALDQSACKPSTRRTNAAR